jgi:signal transduction histidine kinase
VVLAALVAMAALTALALAEADRLADRLARAQDQLARVARIEAQLNAWLLASAEGADAADVDRAMTDLDRGIDAYLATISAERMAIPRDAASLERQTEEMARGEELKRKIAELDAGVPDIAQTRARRAELRALAARIEEGERAEAGAALGLVRRLEHRTTAASAAIFALMTLLCSLGAMAMIRNVGRPLRALAEAAGRIGRSEPASAPLLREGFEELQRVADAFNRLEDELAAQRRALAAHNERLEAEVAERTAELRASNAQLAEIDRTRRLFFSRVGHELRTPATVIRSEAEVALRSRDAPVTDLRESLERVAANSAFLQRRLDDLMALARAEDGRITLRREPVRLDALLADVKALAAPYARSVGMDLVEEGFDQPGLVVEGDKSWLEQALLALVDNAAKFAAGSAAVRLSLRHEGGAVTIGVEDGGPGAPPEALPHLFDSFYRGANGAGVHGAGLGLSVTRWVAEQHGGRVSARNVEGRGLLVELRLPTMP